MFERAIAIRHDGQQTLIGGRKDTDGLTHDLRLAHGVDPLSRTIVRRGFDCEPGLAQVATMRFTTVA